MSDLAQESAPPALTSAQLDVIFGPCAGDTPQARALHSTRRFSIRDGALRVVDPQLKPGQGMTAWELWQDQTLRGRLGELADHGRIALNDPHASDASHDALRARLKTFERQQTLTRASVAEFMVCGAVILEQARLAAWLDLTPSNPPRIEPDSFYGDANCPPWSQGQRLARETRRRLGIEPDAPITHLGRLIEERLGAPVIQAEFTQQQIAGATLAVGGHRGIIVNTLGANQNVWVRRATLAHELGHLLWDPDERLDVLLVDDYNSLTQFSSTDRVEQRANAFAIEFLAPQQALRSMHAQNASDGEALRAIMVTFGISFTAARHHLKNALGRPLKLDDRVDPSPTDDWSGRESYTVEYFAPQATPIPRRGRFAGLTVAALRGGLITRSTAARLLGLPDALSRDDIKSISHFYPDLIHAALTRLSDRRQATADVQQLALSANQAWIQHHAREHAGRWVAIADGVLIGSAATLAKLSAMVEAKDKARTLIFQMGA